MAQDKKRDFTPLWFILGIILLIGGIVVIMNHAFSHGSESISSTWVQQHDQSISEEVSDKLINAIFLSNGFDVVCFDSSAGSFLVRMPKHDHEDNVYDSGWYLVDYYNFIQLQNKSYIIKTFGNLTAITPDITGLHCRNKNVN